MMKLIYLKSALKYNSFDVALGIKIQFFSVLVTIEPGHSLLQFFTTNCLIRKLGAGKTLNQGFGYGYTNGAFFIPSDTIFVGFSGY